jgi:tetratricopeptide (TPR) repeat protein
VLAKAHGRSVDILRFALAAGLVGLVAVVLPRAWTGLTHNIAMTRSIREVQTRPPCWMWLGSSEPGVEVDSGSSTPLAQFWTASALYRQGQHSQGARLLADLPHIDLYLIHCAEVLTAQHRPGEALNLLELAVEADPTSLPARQQLAQSYAAQGLDEKAAQQFSVITSAYDQETPEQLLALINLHRSEGQLQEALDVAQRAVEMYPGELLLHLAAGDVYLEMGDLEAALSAYRQAALLAPDDITTILKIGTVYRRQGDYARAHEQFLEALHLAQAADLPDHVQASILSSLAKNAIDWDRCDLALEYLNGILDMGQDTANVHHQMGICLDQLGDLELALQHLRQAVALEPSRAEYYASLAEALSRADHCPEAMQACTQALELGADQASIVSNCETVKHRCEP